MRAYCHTEPSSQSDEPQVPTADSSQGSGWSPSLTGSLGTFGSQDTASPSGSWDKKRAPLPTRKKSAAPSTSPPRPPSPRSPYREPPGYTIGVTSNWRHQGPTVDLTSSVDLRFQRLPGSHSLIRDDTHRSGMPCRANQIQILSPTNENGRVAKRSTSHPVPYRTK